MRPPASLPPGNSPLILLLFLPQEKGERERGERRDISERSDKRSATRGCSARARFFRPAATTQSASACAEAAVALDGTAAGRRKQRLCHHPPRVSPWLQDDPRAAAPRQRDDPRDAERQRGPRPRAHDPLLPAAVRPLDVAGDASPNHSARFPAATRRLTGRSQRHNSNDLVRCTYFKSKDLFVKMKITINIVYKGYEPGDPILVQFNQMGSRARQVFIPDSRTAYAFCAVREISANG
jgi:hypothetical protein